MPRKPSKFTGDDSANIFYGDDNRDIMEGNGGEDVLVGAGGDDRLSGGDGEDILRGGRGDDVLQGGGGTDLIFGGGGEDRVLADSGDDFVDGGKGEMDTITISAASDEVHISEIGGAWIIATADGFITMRNIELLRFDDGLKTLSFFNYGEVFELTAGVDLFQGASGRDFFLAAYHEGRITLDNRDRIDGGDGSDVLNITVLKSGAIAPSVENVETIGVAVYRASFAIDFANTAGVRTLRFGRSTEGTFTAENVSSMVDLQLDGTISGTLAVEYSADVIGGDSDAQRVTINDAAGAISVAGVEIMNVVSITSTEASNSLTIDSADLHTLNIAGDARISIDGLGTTTKVIDASLAIGGVEVAFTHASGILATGGEGDDVFDFSAVMEPDSDGAVVDAGAGDDFVVFAGTFEGVTAIREGDYWIFTTDGAMVKFKNVELMKFDDATYSVSDLDNGPLRGEALF